MAQLHEFTLAVGPKLPQEDMIEICSAIGYIIKGMPVKEGSEALATFCIPMLEEVAQLASRPTPSKKEIQRICGKSLNSPVPNTSN
jgi:transportin-3